VEQKVIENSKKLNTKKTIIEDLKRLGLNKGETIIVHSSLSSIGWICGGAISLIEALIEVVGSEGTVIMPSHSSGNSDPKDWNYPPVPKSWWQDIRDNIPPFNPSITPTRGLGITPELFRTFPKVIRSNHPQLSFSAWGKNAKKITENHNLDLGMGNNSPLAKIYKLDGKILFIGTNFETNTSFHLAEYRVPNPKIEKVGASILINGKAKWLEYNEVNYDEDCFEEIGKDFEKTAKILKGKIGSADSKLFNQREAVDFALSWLTKKRA